MSSNSLNAQQNTIVTQPTSKKIGFFSTILLVIGSSIGAGIFLKNGEVLGNVQGSFILSIVSWIIAIVAIICMGLTLAEICSANTQNDQGIIGWVKTFNNKFLYKGAKNFMAYIYLPLNFFVMPYYAIMTIQDAFGWSLDWYYVMLICLAIVIWFVVMSGLSSRMGNIQNWIITSVKFLPLAFAAVIGFVLIGTGNVTSGTTPGLMPDPSWPDGVVDSTPLFQQLSPVLGVFCSIPAIFFAFDGFYATAGIQSQMKEPKKVSMAMAVGLAVVSFIDILISVSLLLCSTNGKIDGIEWLNANPWLLQTINFLIAIGILGIINGFAIYTPIFYEDLVRKGEIPFCTKYEDKLNHDRPKVGVSISLIITIPIIIIFTLIGAYGYIDINNYSFSSHYASTMHTATLYSFVDLMANWTSVLAFACIVAATIGCLKNRKTKKVKVEKSKVFVPCAWVSIVIVGISLLFIVVATIANIGLVSYYFANNMYADRIEGGKNLLGVCLTFVVLILFLAIMFTEPIVQKIKKTY